MPGKTAQFGATASDEWIEKYDALERFISLNRSWPAEASGTDRYDGLGVDLGYWARYQRRRRARGIMPQWQSDLLDRLDGYSWAPRDERWLGQLEQVRTFIQATGRLPSYRSADRQERAAAAWVQKQRHLNTRGQLSEERMDALRTPPVQGRLSLSTIKREEVSSETGTLERRVGWR